MIPSFDSFDYFLDLAPLALVILPLLALIGRSRHAGVLRRALFIAGGLYLLALIAPRLALVHLAFWLVIAALQPLVSATGERKHGLAVLFAALLVPTLPVLAWKAVPVDFVVQFNLWPNRLIRPLSDQLTAFDLNADIIAPIGLSFGAFRAADLLIKSNLGLVDRLSAGRTLAYGLFAPLLVVGPIATYDEVEPALERHVPLDRRRGLDGIQHLVSGLVKVFVLAAPLAWSAELFADAEANSQLRLWVALVAYGWYFYLNFAGYSDLAIGIGRLFGGDIRENFNRPYFQTTPAAFWNNWHISLSRFLRVNVFTPISAGRPNRQTVGTMITMMLIALWHGITWATFVFGLYHGISLVLHRKVSARRPAMTDPPPVVRIGKSVAVFLWFVVSLPLIELSLDETLSFYRALLLGGSAT